jgi:hypothetical protein
MPTPTALDRIAAGVHDIATALQNPTEGSPLSPLDSSQVAALDDFLVLLTATLPEPRNHHRRRRRYQTDQQSSRRSAERSKLYRSGQHTTQYPNRRATSEGGKRSPGCEQRRYHISYSHQTQIPLPLTHHHSCQHRRQRHRSTHHSRRRRQAPKHLAANTNSIATPITESPQHDHVDYRVQPCRLIHKTSCNQASSEHAAQIFTSKQSSKQSKLL